MQFDIAPSTYLDVGHSRLAYWRLGTGPDVVFVHGWPLHSGTYRRLLPEMTRHFTCHLFDLPGAGFTEVTHASPLDLRSHCDTALRAVKAMGISRYALVAHDSGGVVTRMMAAATPERVTGLVLGNTEIPGHRSPLLVSLIAASKTRLGRAAFMAALRSPRLLRSNLVMGACFEDMDHMDDEFHALFIAPLLADAQRAERGLALASTFDWAVVDDLRRAHQKIRAPVRLIWGRNDPYFPLFAARNMQREFAAGCQLDELPGKLFVHEERPLQFAEVATSFLQRCFDSGERARGESA